MLIKLLRKRLKSPYISSSGKRTVKLENLKSAYEPSGSLGRNYPWKRPGVFVLNPGRDAIPLQCSTPPPPHPLSPGIKFACSDLYTWVERGTVRAKCLVQGPNTMSPARGPFLESAGNFSGP